jgi:hypothetical protein
MLLKDLTFPKTKDFYNNTNNTQAQIILEATITLLVYSIQSD